VQPIRHPSVLASPALSGLVAAAAFALAGCAVDSPPTLGNAEVNTDCPNFGCNSNSPVVGWPPFHELDEGPEGGSAAPAGARRSAGLGGGSDLPEDYDQGGAFNGEGLRVVHLRKGGKRYRLDVEGAQLRALDGRGQVALMREKLKDSVIVLEHVSKTIFYVFIEDFSDTLTFWIGEEENIETFFLSWSFSENNPPSSRDPVCPLPATLDEWNGAAFHQAIFFQGDRYDPQTKHVIATGSETKGWFNVACAGSATAKMHTNRHTEAGSNEEYTAPPLDRQALLMMFTATYCGSGPAFTQVNEPLRWGKRGWKVIDLPDPIEYESVWDSDGALCLSVPRMGDDDEELAETLAAVMSQCDLDPCEALPSFPTRWKRNGYLITANPPPDGAPP
jgi:hypothetical protein